MTITSKLPPGHYRTFTGRVVDPWNLKPEDVNILDVAHVLSIEPRFGGHLGKPYSVAQHSLLVAECTKTLGPLVALKGLVHDATEAYLRDLPSPVKHHAEMAGYRAAEARAHAAIYAAFGLVSNPADDAAVKRADEAMLYVEMRDLRGYTDIAVSDDVLALASKISIGVVRPWDEIELLFLAEFYNLSMKAGFTTNRAGP